MFWSFCDEKFCYEEGEIDYEKQAKAARLNKMKESEVKSQKCYSSYIFTKNLVQNTHFRTISVIFPFQAMTK